MKSRQRFVLRVLPVLLAGLGAGAVHASGFQLLEQNASGIGNAYAGTAAVAENASTIYFNPAGMTQLQARELSVGVDAIQTSARFSNQGSTHPTAFGGGAATGSNGGDAGTLAAVPHGYFSWAVNKDLYLGVGVGVPFGLKTEYTPDWVGRFQSIKFDIESVNVNPSIAYRVNDKVSLGFGVNWQHFEAEYLRQATATTQIKLTGDSDKWGWNAGALFSLSPSTKLGVSYRSTIKHKVEGSLSGAVNSPAEASIELPDTVIVSMTQGLGDRWELLGDVAWTGWSSIDRVNIIRKDTGATAQTLDAHFKDTWRLALGMNYKFNDAWKLKFGMAYDETPVRDAEHRLTALPDEDRVWFSVGSQWKPNKQSALDVGLAYLYIDDTSINNNQDSPVALARGTVRGSYSSSIWVLGVQYSMAF